jgi:hypothetical protein
MYIFNEAEQIFLGMAMRAYVACPINHQIYIYSLNLIHKFAYTCFNNRQLMLCDISLVILLISVV